MLVYCQDAFSNQFVFNIPLNGNMCTQMHAHKSRKDLMGPIYKLLQKLRTDVRKSWIILSDSLFSH